MEGRRPNRLVLEMTELTPADYAAFRPTAAVFENCVPDRADLPRTIPEFSTLGVIDECRNLGLASFLLQKVRMRT